MSQAHSVAMPQKMIVQPLRPAVAKDANALAEVELVAVVVAVLDDQPMVRVVPDATGGWKLPSAAFRLDGGQSLDESLRAGVLRETALELGYVEQLQASAVAPSGSADGTPRRNLSIGYLALAHDAESGQAPAGGWRSWYDFLPWEDWRRGRPHILRELLEPRLRAWAEQDEAPDDSGLTRLERARMVFGLDNTGWDEERVVDRYDLLARAGLLDDEIGQRLTGDHRRSLAVAIGRLRGKIKSRPVVFELMPERFTLFELQRTVEAILGPHLHKQNFRRLVEHMGLVEPTEGIKSHTGGRPAKLFRFRHSVLLERLQPGVRVRSARA
jgi:hypothetical protein